MRCFFYLFFVTSLGSRELNDGGGGDRDSGGSGGDGMMRKM